MDAAVTERTGEIMYNLSAVSTSVFVLPCVAPMYFEAGAPHTRRLTARCRHSIECHVCSICIALLDLDSLLTPEIALLSSFSPLCWPSRRLDLHLSTAVIWILRRFLNVSRSASPESAMLDASI